MLRVQSPLNEREEEVISLAMDCAFAVHRELGPGFKKRIYEEAYCLELNARGIRFDREQKIKVRYKAWSIPGQRIDLVVESLVIVEIKAVSKLARVHERQVRSYLKTMGLRAGLLVNFNVAMVKNGIKRVVQTGTCPRADVVSSFRRFVVPRPEGAASDRLGLLRLSH